MDNKLRIVIADDERPARSFLRSLVESFEDTEVVGEAETGGEAVEIIELLKPDLALLDLQMPEVSGLEAVRLIKRKYMPLIAFVTAYDEYTLKAFEINAVDYLLKPVERSRLRETLDRAIERLERSDFREREADHIKETARALEETSRTPFLERLPLKHRDSIVLVPVNEITSIVADSELLHITTLENIRYVINFRLKDLELRLDPARFVRLSRGTIVNIGYISHVSSITGGTIQVFLKNSQKFTTSRLQTRIFREKYLKI